MILSSLVTFIIIYVVYNYLSSNKRTKYLDYADVPLVSGSLPIVGHGLQFSTDIITYIRDCYKKYGSIFRLQIFNTDMVVVCDRNMIQEYNKAKENDLSLYKVLERLFFAYGFFDNPDEFETSIQIVKKTVAVRFDEFVPKIHHEALKMIKIMKDKSTNNEPADLTKEMIKFVSRTSAQCFIAMDLSEEFMDILVKFTILLNKIVVLTYFLPGWLLNMTINKYFLRPYKLKMIEMMDSEIEKYREDPKKKDSIVFRTAVDFVDQDGNSLSNHQIGEIVVCLLYVSSENTALGLSATITELANNETFWERVKTETSEHLINDDMQSLFSNQLLDSCVFEAARLNSHIFALNRKPIKQKTLGKYYVGDIDTIALCEPMLMCLDCSDDVFKEPSIYNPDRFIKESKGPNHVMTWGTQNTHLCPGRQFAIYEIKMATALIVNNFERFKISEKEYANKDYFSPSAFAERKISVQLKPLSEPLEKKKKENFMLLKHNDQEYKIECLDNKGWLIRNYIDITEQKDYYNYTVNLSKKSNEQNTNEIMKESKNPVPLTYYNLVYTGKSNCDVPQLWFDWSEKIWNLVKTSTSKSLSECPKFNSLYAQLYGGDSFMKVHKDEFVDWGISISLGASCEFVFDDKTIILHSGDVLIADFSQVNHGVNKILTNAIPQWFNNENTEQIETFDKYRISVQIRQIKENLNLSEEEFKSMINK